MSNYCSSGQFEDIEMERRIQEEIRRRSLHHQVPGAPPSQSQLPPPPSGSAAEYAQHLSMMQQRQQQQQQHHPGPPGVYPGYPGGPGVPHGHSPYSRAPNPYGGIADARAAASAYQQPCPPPGSAGGQMSQMYGMHQELHRQQQQAAVAGSYGAPYGSGATPPPGHASIDHHYSAAYGLGSTPQPSSLGYTRETSYGSAGGAQSPHDHAAMMQHHQHQLQSQHLHASQKPPLTDPYGNKIISTGNSNRNVKEQDVTNAGTPASTPSSNKATQSSYSSSASQVNSPIEEDDISYERRNNLNGNSQHTMESSSSFPSSLTKATPVKGGGRQGISPKSTGSSGKKSTGSKDKSPIHSLPSTARVIIQDGTTIIEDGDQRWYTGYVPLGVDDDKYWLSELQVFLRSHFAEAFGATEDDIAAPMHGRNKPIALGQVGIRCMHCKRKSKNHKRNYPSQIAIFLYYLTSYLLLMLCVIYVKFQSTILLNADSKQRHTLV
jgi:hypothetical protein